MKLEKIWGGSELLDLVVLGSYSSIVWIMDLKLKGLMGKGLSGIEVF